MAKSYQLLSLLVVPVISRVGPAVLYRLPGESVILEFVILEGSPAIELTELSWQLIRPSGEVANITSMFNLYTPTTLTI